MIFPGITAEQKERIAAGLLFNNPGIINIKCTDNVEYMRKLPDESIDSFMFSPPYLLKKSYETNDKSSFEEYVERTSVVIKECHRLLKPDGIIAFQSGTHSNRKIGILPLDIIYFPVFQQLGMYCVNRIIWQNTPIFNYKNRLSRNYETVLIMAKNSKLYTYNDKAIRIPPKYKKMGNTPEGKNPGDIVRMPSIGARHPEETKHDAVYPVALVEFVVRAFTKPNDIVFDPYLGSGTTVIGAIKNNRRGWGTELLPEYYELAKHKIYSYLTGKLVPRPLGKPIWNPRII